jgi:hypothetical protein
MGSLFQFELRLRIGCDCSQCVRPGTHSFDRQPHANTVPLQGLSRRPSQSLACAHPSLRPPLSEVTKPFFWDSSATPGAPFWIKRKEMKHGALFPLSLQLPVGDSLSSLPYSLCLTRSAPRVWHARCLVECTRTRGRGLPRCHRPFPIRHCTRILFNSFVRSAPGRAAPRASIFDRN